ncbi:hypothetical protein RIF29_15203 [Crotalaria pallida]|uniref:Uncharacterized protein n=1 Tax=Crotalaria pallida TaxID=3830 RepID=A0AAN9FD30_CROPI
MDDSNLVAARVMNKNLTGVIFLDCGSDMRSSHKVPGNLGMRKGKLGSGFGSDMRSSHRKQFDLVGFNSSIGLLRL